MGAQIKHFSDVAIILTTAVKQKNVRASLATIPCLLFSTTTPKLRTYTHIKLR